MSDQLSDSYLVSERLGQAQAVSDYELYLFVSDLRDELSSERWQELTQLFQEPPWIGELVRLRLEFADAEAFAQTHPVAVSDEAWERMLQKHRLASPAGPEATVFTLESWRRLVANAKQVLTVSFSDPISAERKLATARGEDDAFAVQDERLPSLGLEETIFFESHIFGWECTFRSVVNEGSKSTRIAALAGDKLIAVATMRGSLYSIVLDRETPVHSIHLEVIR